MLYHCAKKRGFWLVPVAMPPRQTIVWRLEAIQNMLSRNYEIASSLMFRFYYYELFKL